MGQISGDDYISNYGGDEIDAALAKAQKVNVLIVSVGTAAEHAAIVQSAFVAKQLVFAWRQYLTRWMLMQLQRVYQETASGKTYEVYEFSCFDANSDSIFVTSLKRNVNDATDAFWTGTTTPSAWHSLFLRDGSKTATGDFSMGGHRISSLGPPIATSDATTKYYVDNTVANS